MWSKSWFKVEKNFHFMMIEMVLGDNQLEQIRSWQGKSRGDTKPFSFYLYSLIAHFLRADHICRLHNSMSDHLSRLSIHGNIPMLDEFLDEQLLSINAHKMPWYAHIINYLVIGQVPSRWHSNIKHKFFSDLKY